MRYTAKAFQQVYLDSIFGGVIIQAGLSGVYTYIIYRTIVVAAPRLRNGRHIPLTVTLVMLYILDFINLAISWSSIRFATIANDETRLSISTALDDTAVNILALVMDTTYYAPFLIADVLMTWRCYVLWDRRKWILALLCVPLLEEAACIVINMVSILHPGGLSSKLDFLLVAIFNFMSVGITVVSTSLITYRVIAISREAGNTASYRHILEILIESGMLYTSLNIVYGVTSVTLNSQSASAGNVYVSSFLQPMTGIAPTLLFERVINHSEALEEIWSQPPTLLNFKKSTKVGDIATDTHLDRDLEASWDSGSDRRNSNVDHMAGDRNEIQHKSLPAYRVEGDVVKRCKRMAVASI